MVAKQIPETVERGATLVEPRLVLERAIEPVAAVFAEPARIPRLVASTTLESVDWQNSSLIQGDVAQELRRLKRQPGKDIPITGSATLVRSLLRQEHDVDPAVRAPVLVEFFAG